MSATPQRIRKLARDRLGLASLRPGQLEGVESVLAGRDTLCVMSTGYGKSAIYELAGVTLDRPTVVVSPLIALQRDQVESIEGDQGLRAGVLNSTLRELRQLRPRPARHDRGERFALRHRGAGSARGMGRGNGRGGRRRADHGGVRLGRI